MIIRSTLPGNRTNPALTDGTSGANRQTRQGGPQGPRLCREATISRPCLPHAQASPGARCAVLVPTGTRRCATHEAEFQAWRNARRGDRYGAEYQAERRRVLRGATVCALCGKPGTRRDPLTADHITPAAHGGGAIGNLRPAHRSCNSARGATTRSS